MNEKTGKLATCALVAILTCFADAATEWPVRLATVNGMTPSQQLTNAVAQAADGDTIRFEAGTYQLDGESFMLVTTRSNSGGTASATSRNHVFANGKNLHFVGASSGKWDNATIIRGNGNDRFFYGTKAGSTFKGLTFENFAANDAPSVNVDNNNLSPTACGGVIQ